jgi:integrase
MAKIRARRRSDGGITYQVSWVLGGGRTAGKGSAHKSFATRSEAEKFQRLVNKAGQQWPPGWDDAAPPTVFNPTLDEVELLWLDAEHEKILLARKKPYSVQRDHRSYQTHIAVHLGKRRFTEINRRDVKSWVLAMAQTASPKSVANRHGLLSQIMNFGIRELELRPHNPCQGTMLPRNEYNGKLRFLSHDEWRLLRSCLSPDVLLLCDLALHTGMRWGEVTALRVGDINASASDHTVLTIQVIRAWSARSSKFDSTFVNIEAAETTMYKIGAPKNRRTRWVQVSGEFAERLRIHIQDKRESDYVFRITSGGPWRYKSFYENRWAPAVALAKNRGLTRHVTFHMLRHTFAVWLLAAGENIHVISARLGHSSIQITIDVYGGLLDLHDAGTSRRMSEQMLYATSESP